MIRLLRPQDDRQRESAIALINIVFLMLIGFLVSGTFMPQLETGVRLVTPTEAAAPRGALLVNADGELRSQGRLTDARAYVSVLKRESGLAEVRLAADRDLPAGRLIEIVAELNAAGADAVKVVTERTR